MPLKHRDPYPPEFKNKIVALVLAGRTPEELAAEFEHSKMSRFEVGLSKPSSIAEAVAMA